MELSIYNNTRMSQIKKQFASVFPNLKIEFYKVPHKEGMGTPEKYKWTEDKELKEIRNHFNEGVIKILPGITPTVLEKILREKFDLYVQVFRRSSNEWIETTSTDNWTLTKLNQLAVSENDGLEI
jgi:hypothetical protein